jgi:hypothetical protein
MAPSRPRPTTKPRRAKPTTSATTGLNLNLTIIITTARIATPVVDDDCSLRHVWTPSDGYFRPQVTPRQRRDVIDVE